MTRNGFLAAYQMSNWRLWLFIPLLFILTLAYAEIRSEKGLALLPWLYLVLFIFNLNYLKNLWHYFRTPVVASIFLSCWILLSDSATDFTRLGIRHSLQYLVWIPVAAATYTLLSNSKQWPLRIQYALVVSLLLTFAVAAWQRFVLGHERPDIFSHNVLVGTIALGISISTLTIGLASTTPQSTHSKLLSVISIAIAVGIAILTSARGTVVSIILTICLVLAFSGIKRYRYFSYGAVLTCIVLVYLSAPRFALIASDMQGYLQEQRYSSIGVRLDAWRWMVENYAIHPVFGWSAEGVQKSFHAFLLSFQPPGGPPIYFFEHLHSDYIQLYAAYGAPAMIAFIVFILALSIPSMQRLWASKALRNSHSIPDALHLGICLLFMIASLGDSFSFWTPETVACQTCLGLSAGTLMFWRIKTAPSTILKLN